MRFYTTKVKPSEKEEKNYEKIGKWKMESKSLRSTADSNHGSRDDRLRQ